MGALGVAILSNNKSIKKIYFDFNISNIDFETIGRDCNGCENNCEIIDIYSDNVLIDSIGGKCERSKIYKLRKVM